MKTAMQSAIELIDLGNLDDLYQVRNYLESIGVDMEKRQIIDAYTKASSDAYMDGVGFPNDNTFTDGDDYYNQTYK